MPQSAHLGFQSVAMVSCLTYTSLPSWVLLLFLLLISTLVNSQLRPDFYDETCPNTASIVANTIFELANNNNVVAPSLVRLLNHDCFVEGCDASIMISSTTGNLAEQDASDNSNLPPQAFNAVIAAKRALEAACPGVVSCADVLVLSARDAIGFLGGPSWQVDLGRRDGLVSEASMVPGRLPVSNADLFELINEFGDVNLTIEDLVVLSGAHTIGFSSCNEFAFRLYNFSGTVKVDPNMNPAFVQQLQSKCFPDGSGTQPIPFDTTPFVFDNAYYKCLQNSSGLLLTDSELFTNDITREIVNSLAASQELFFQSFVSSIQKLSSIGVKTGTQGEIRADCTKFNADTTSAPAPM